MKEKTFRAGSLELQVAEGPDSGPPLVLLHGVTRKWQDWLPIMPSLALRWKVHAIDLRGHGHSGRAAGGYRVADYVEDVTAFLKEGLSEPAIVLGHSLGAMVAAAVAAEAPRLVRALVMEDPPFDMMGPRIGETMYLDLFTAYRDLLGSTVTIAALAEALGEVSVRFPGRPDPVRLGEVRDATSLWFLAACLRRIDPDVLTLIVEGRWLDGYDVEETLGRVLCPALLIQGDYWAGGALPEPYGTDLASKLLRGAHVRLAGVGHQIHWMEAEVMARLVTGFLESLD